MSTMANPLATVNRMERRLPKSGWLVMLGALLLLTAAVYWPGLRGVYVLDDFPNIVDNTHVQVTSLDWRAWAEAAWSSPSTDLHRPLASLTFALNYFFDGLAPWPMKAVNLLIHLLNGALLFLLLRALIASEPRRGDDAFRIRRAKALALLVTAAWLLHPINLTAVLYVVQRMESLAQAFVLIALLFYLGARRRQLAGARGGAMLWLGVPLAMLAGLSAKESAALVPAYALVLEFTVLGRQLRSAAALREIKAFFGLFLVLPVCLGLAWLMPRVLSPKAWTDRPFTLIERLLTEPRVLIDYMSWTLAPLPGRYSLYRDDYQVSRGLFDPWTTLPAIATLALLLGMAWAARRRRPLIALGLGWFFAAHALTATVIPLEIAFEHRNYFASIGLLLAAFDLMMPASTAAPFPIVRRALPAIFVLLCALSTSMRAVEWGDPVRLALSESARHPTSPRATYELGRVLVILSGYRADSPLLPRAYAALDKAAAVPGARTQPDSALIALAARTGRPVEDAWWDRLIVKLRDRPPTLSDADALQFLAECTRRGDCPLPPQRMVAAFTAALSHEPPDPAVLYAYAIYAYNGLGDTSLALTLATDAVRYAPTVPQYRVNLINFLLDLGRRDDAAAELATLRAQNRFGRLQSAIDAAEHRLAEAPAHGTASGGT